MENEHKSQRADEHSRLFADDPATESNSDNRRDTDNYEQRTQESSLPDWGGDIRQPDRVGADEADRSQGLAQETQRNDTQADRDKDQMRDDFRRRG